MKLPAALLACACLLLAGAVAPSPAAAKACSAPAYPGNGYFTSMSAKRTTCKEARRVALAHHDCRTESGVLGRCSRKVRGFSCSEQRQSIPTETNSLVKCRDGGRRVTFTYQQNT